MITIYPKAEILFPSSLIVRLEDLRESKWQDLVKRVAGLPEVHPERLAFILMMIRLDGCLKCYNGSFKFMRGCELCARQTVMQFKEGDESLLRMYRRALRDVKKHLEKHGYAGLADPPDLDEMLDS
jgi:predicted SpoU family rRNA methylase